MRDITLNDYDTKSELSIHIILGISDYTKIKTPERARIGSPGEPIAELTKLGWYIVSPGWKFIITKDCMEVSEKQDKPDGYGYEKFMEKLGFIPGGTTKPN